MNRRLSLIAVLISVFAGCGKQERAHSTSPTGGANASAAAPVETVRAEKRTLRRLCTQPGQVEAFEEAPIYARVEGYVERLLVDIGDQVKGPRFDDDGVLTEPGQPLAQLAVPELQDDVRQREAALVQSQAQIEQATAAVRVAVAGVAIAEARIHEAESTVTRTDAEAERWRREHERMDQLAAKGTVTPKLVDETKQQWQAAEASRQEAAAKIEAARAALDETQAAVVSAQSDELAAKANKEVVEAQLQHARTMLDFGTLRAPFDGIVAERRVNTGHFVTSNGSEQQPLFVLVQADTVRVFLDVPEDDASFVEKGKSVEIRVDALGNEPIRGTVTRTSWSLNSTTRTLRTEVDVENSNGKLRPGMYVQVSVAVEERSNAIVVPASAIVTAGASPYCVAIRDGRAARRPVQLGMRAAGEVEVVSGLAESELLVKTGAAGIRDGQLVELTPPPK